LHDDSYLFFLTKERIKNRQVEHISESEDILVAFYLKSLSDWVNGYKGLDTCSLG
jgi:hypothetical protein